MPTQTSAPIGATAQIVSTETVKPDFGKGRYSFLAQEVFEDSQVVFRCSAETAERLARQVASDIGAVMANAPVGVKLGKMNNNGALTISEACKVKGVTVTHAIYCLRALRFAAEAGQHGFTWAATKWSISETLRQELGHFEK